MDFKHRFLLRKNEYLNEVTVNKQSRDKFSLIAAFLVFSTFTIASLIIVFPLAMQTFQHSSAGVTLLWFYTPNDALNM